MIAVGFPAHMTAEIHRDHGTDVPWPSLAQRSGAIRGASKRFIAWRAFLARTRGRGTR